MKTTHLFIKIGFTNHIGAYLLEDIKNKLNERYLNGSTTKIIDISKVDYNNIRIEIDWCVNFNDDSDVFNGVNTYIKGMVSGILIWSGVEVE